MGLRVVGTIEKIALETVPSIFAGVPERPVARIALAVERAEDTNGRAIDPAGWRGLEFEGAAELTSSFASGDRVEIETTTDSGLHVASIRKAPTA